MYLFERKSRKIFNIPIFKRLKLNFENGFNKVFYDQISWKLKSKVIDNCDTLREGCAISVLKKAKLFGILGLIKIIPNSAGQKSNKKSKNKKFFRMKCKY